jgi:hypothetical protein
VYLKKNEIWIKESHSFVLGRKGNHHLFWLQRSMTLLLDQKNQPNKRKSIDKR